MAVSFSDLQLAFEFVSSGGMGENEAYLDRQAGEIYWHSEFGDNDEELPDDIDDEKYISIPDKRELDLGKPLVLDFAREFLPDDYDEVRHIFSRRGAYRRYKDLLVRRSALIDDVEEAPPQAQVDSIPRRSPTSGPQSDNSSFHFQDPAGRRGTASCGCWWPFSTFRQDRQRDPTSPPRTRGRGTLATVGESEPEARLRAELKVRNPLPSCAESGTR